MALSNQQYQDIIREYDKIRSRNYQLSAKRLDHVSSQIPEIRRINEEMASLTASRTRKLLYGDSSPADPSFADIIKDLSAKKRSLLVRHGYPEDYLDPLYDCPDCQDTGYIGSEKCHCFIRRIISLLYDRSNLKEVLARENFDHFRIDYFPDHFSGQERSPRDNMEEVLRICFDFIRNFQAESPGKSQNLLIYGNAGVGKSFLSHCIADALLGQGRSVLYLSAYRLFEMLADHTFRRNEEKDTVDLIFQCELLIIDDLGTEMTNSFVNSSLFTCLNERLSGGLSTIINTNLSLEQISAIYSERIFSRITESYTPLHIIGDDIRLKKALSSHDEPAGRLTEG